MILSNKHLSSVHDYVWHTKLRMDLWGQIETESSFVAHQITVNGSINLGWSLIYRNIVSNSIDHFTTQSN